MRNTNIRSLNEFISVLFDLTHWIRAFVIIIVVYFDDIMYTRCSLIDKPNQSSHLTSLKLSQSSNFDQSCVYLAI